MDNKFEAEIEKAKKDIISMSKCGFHTFFCPVRHNEFISTTYTKRAVHQLQTIAKKSLNYNECGKISLNFVPKIFLSREAPYIKNLSSLAYGKTNYIFLELPIDASPDHVPEALNKILYNCKLIPIFTDFQLYSLLYDPIEIDKMIRIKGSAFQFGLKTICEPQNLHLIKKIIKQGNTVLLGTGCKRESLNIRELSHNLNSFRNAVSDSVFREIVVNAKKLLN